MRTNRNHNIVVKSQFNINGSRGRDAGKFVADYVSRDSATDRSSSYIPDGGMVDGDGVAFTLDSTAISRAETLRLADVVQNHHLAGNRAIQQMVISFDHDYLVEMGIVPEDVDITKKGDYRFNYDDVRLRHAVRRGLQALVDAEGYRDGRIVAAIQHDTLHIHVHAVVYENHPKLSRLRGREEKGVVKGASFGQLSHDIDRSLRLTKSSTVPTHRSLALSPKEVRDDGPTSDVVVDHPHVDVFLALIEQREREAALRRKNQRLDEILDNQVERYDLEVEL